jgi:dihydrofolate reductase
MSQRKLILSMQISLDGLAGTPDDKGDWILNTEEEWADLFTDIDSADTYLLGRKMYPGYFQYWQSVLHKPDSDPNELRFAKVEDKATHIVFTRGAGFEPEWKNWR